MENSFVQLPILGNIKSSFKCNCCCREVKGNGVKLLFSNMSMYICSKCLFAAGYKITVHRMPNYHFAYNNALIAYKEGVISFEDAAERISFIEAEMYKSFPESEPDGDITYAASVALDDLKEMRQGCIKNE